MLTTTSREPNQRVAFDVVGPLDRVLGHWWEETNLIIEIRGLPTLQTITTQRITQSVYRISIYPCPHGILSSGDYSLVRIVELVDTMGVSWGLSQEARERASSWMTPESAVVWLAAFGDRECNLCQYCINLVGVVHYLRVGVRVAMAAV